LTERNVMNVGPETSAKEGNKLEKKEREKLGEIGDKKKVLSSRKIQRG